MVATPKVLLYLSNTVQSGGGGNGRPGSAMSPNGGASGGDGAAAGIFYRLSGDQASITVSAEPMAELGEGVE